MQMLSCHFLVKQFQMGGDRLPLVSVSLYILVFPYIFLLFDCFESVHSLTTMKMRSCHFLVKQFQMGGDHLPLVSTCFLCSGISLYLPII